MASNARSTYSKFCQSAEQFSIYQAALKAFEHGGFSETIMLLTDPQANAEADPISQFLLCQAIAQQEGNLMTQAKTGLHKKMPQPL
jgi:hypothetical protein